MDGCIAALKNDARHDLHGRLLASRIARVAVCVPYYGALL